MLPLLALVLATVSTSLLHAQGGSVWRQSFNEGWTGWEDLRSSWGLENASFHEEPGIAGQFMRVRFPQGSLDPATMRREGRPYGGMGFKKRLFERPMECARLTYKLRFASDFDFVRGGKLPGLYGGAGNSGGRIPNGTDGFSTRYMWLNDGNGQVYAYLPTSVTYGTSIGKGQFRFARGIWHTLTQEVMLNQPGHHDGRIRVWLDNRLVVDQADLLFRTTSSLGINGIFVDTFFGGNDDTWRSRQDTYIDFAEVVVSSCAS